MHNDSTSISVQGLYRDADGTPQGGKATPVITFRHSKNHRPDLKQLVWILTVLAGSMWVLNATYPNPLICSARLYCFVPG